MAGVSRLTRRRLALGFAGACATLLALWLAAWLAPLPERLETAPSKVVYFEDGTTAHVYLAPDDRWRIHVPLDEVDPAYVAALLAFEDRRFFWHPGVDPAALVRAALSNLRAGDVVSGGSTLTMQLVRVLEPRPRTLRSKIVEAARAVQLELRFSKRTLLEYYLQFVPFGRNVEGVEAAALAYFGHRASALSSREIAILLAVPQQPTLRAPSPGNRARLQEAASAVADRLAPAGHARFAEVAEHGVRDVPESLRAFPRLAPHAARWMSEQLPSANALYTTLNRNVQLLAETMAARVRARARDAGIHNIAIVVADQKAGTIEALVGNFEFWDEAHGGQIGGFTVPRSPGSLLKPFIYALAIDRGIAIADSLITDIPVRYPGYAPRNYDGEFQGLVRLEDALAFSLNIPFVNLLEQVGVEPFLGFLHQAGVASLHAEPGYYGLSAAVGGIEITPLEVAHLYAGLARGGTFRRLAWRAAADRADPARLLSPGAAWLARQALSKRDRPDFPTRRDAGGTPPDIHWKTGTSFGNHDAWSAGSAGRHTAVVWMGNLDQTPSKALVGADTAAPVLFDVLEGLQGSRPPAHDPAPPDLTGVEVCSFSGRIPTPACPHRKLAWARKSAVPTEPCPYHAKLDVDRESGLALSPSCRAGRDYETRTFLNLPASVSRWMKDQSRSMPEAPSAAPFCATAGAERPRIVSPTASQTAFLLPGIPADRQEIPLEAETKHPGGRLHWFVDGRFLGTIRADERLWWTPEPGDHELLVTDDSGGEARQVLRVRRGPG